MNNSIHPFYTSKLEAKVQKMTIRHEESKMQIIRY